MKRKIVWLLVSCLMVAALVLASCGPAEEEEEEQVIPPPVEKEEEIPAEEEGEMPPEESDMVTVRLTKLDGTVVEKSIEKPKYGGSFTYIWNTDTLYFDEAFGHQFYARTLYQTNDTLVEGDWARGPAGTGETDWIYLAFPRLDLLAGRLAESWEITEPDTIIYHIRKGVHFHDKPPTNGRELTADDVAFTMRYLWESPRSYHAYAYTWKDNIQDLDGHPYIIALDKWTVVIKTLPEALGRIFEHSSSSTFIMPRDAIEQYGDLNDWRNSCGTGAFMMTDFVNGSSCTFVRNPNFWQKDPLLPENQLPYLDTLKFLIIPDISTQLSALRTGKIDHHWFLTLEDAKTLLQAHPELQYKKFLSDSPAGLFMRVDKPELPFQDIRVRRALHLAINNQEIADEYYIGEAQVYNWPVVNAPDFADCFVPFDELPESAQELFSYDPEKAKQLLTEAGYPNGFKTEVCTYSGYVDLLSMVKAYWAEIGVDLELDIREFGAYTSIGNKKIHNEMYTYGMCSAIPFRFTRIAQDQMWNYSMVNDPIIEKAHSEINADRFDEAKRRQLMREVAPYMVDQAYVFVFPSTNVFHIWQPWVKGYHGERYSGYMGTLLQFPKYIWIDQDLKYEMTGRR